MNVTPQSVPFPVAEIAIGLLFVCVFWLRVRPERIDRARVLVAAALVGSLLTLVLATGWMHWLGAGASLEGILYVVDGAGYTHLLGVDGLSSSFGMLALAVSIVAVLAAERSRLSLEALNALSLSTAANLLVLFSRTLWMVALGLVVLAVMVPTLQPRRRQDNGAQLMARVFLGLGAAAFAAATFVLSAVCPNAWALVGHLELELLSDPQRWLVLTLMLVAIVAREGVFPLHAWFVPLAARDAAFGPAVTLLPHVGVYLVLRVVIPSFPEELETILPLLSGLAAASALLLALRSVVQRSLGRAVALIVLSQSALILVGIETLNLEGVAGGLMAVTATSLSGVALLATTSFATSRMGDADLRRFGGLGANTPRLAAAFLAFGLAMVAFPGTVGFVGEELIFHGAFEASIPAAIAIILAAALNGYMVLFLFAKAFLGPAKRSAWMKDLVPLEMTVVVLGLVFVIGLGLVPQPLVSFHAPQAMEISPASADPHGAGGAHD